MHKLMLILSLLILSGCNPEKDQDFQVKRHEGQQWKLLDQNHGHAGSAWGLKDCASCHVISDIHKQQEQRLQQLVKDKSYQSCAGCHGDNNTSLKRQCLICHNNDDLPAAPYYLGNNSHRLSQSNSHQLTANNSPSESSLSDEDCLSCHKLSDMNGEFNRQVDLTRLIDHNGELQPYRNESDFCLRCHNDRAAISEHPLPAAGRPALSQMENYYRSFDRHGGIDGSGDGTYSGLRKNTDGTTGYRYQSLVECSDCHEMHGSHNQKLLLPSSRVGLSQLDISLRASDYSINTDKDDYSQLCVMCHQMNIVVEKGAKNAGNGLSGVHETASSCLACHKHGSSTQAGL